MELTGTPETLGMGAVIIALITAWVKIRPAMKKIEVEENTSLRGDLFQRIKDLEETQKAERVSHQEALKEIKAEYEGAIKGMREQHDRIIADYEDKLLRLQVKIDELLKMLLAHNNVQLIEEKED